MEHKNTQVSKIGKQVFCGTCNCYVPSASLVVSHEQGKKHQRLLKKKDNKQKSLQNSVYVTGFKKNTDVELNLTKLFTKYGNIKDIYVDKEKSNYAIVEFDAEKSVQMLLLESDTHVLDGHQLTVKARRLNKEQIKSDDGNSKRVKETNQSCDDIAHTNSFIEVLSKCSDVSSQMTALVGAMELTSEDIQLRIALCELLQTIFKEVYPDCNVLPFGSTVTQLGFRACDLDLTLITNELCQYQHKRKRIPTLEGKDDNMTPSDSSDQSVKVNKEINEITEILRRFAPGCKNVFPLKSAHCPLIKFEHKDSGLHCDLSINNRLAVKNSELLRLYGQADSRFKPLAYTVRLWAKSKKIAGKGALQLTQYALALMVIHFLQQCEPAVLPCLQEINNSILDENDDWSIDGWFCYFYKDISSLDFSKNCLSSGSLLTNFFKYYWQFDFKSHVISIKTTKRLSRDAYFSQLSSDGLGNILKEGPVCVVDPFEVTHNVAQNITVDGLHIIKAEVRKALLLCGVELRERNFLASKDTDAHQEVRTSQPADFLKLLKPDKDSSEKKQQKNPKVKYIFDVYSSEKRSMDEMCSYCARVVLQILENDLKMHCKVDYQYSKQSAGVEKSEISLKEDLEMLGMIPVADAETKDSLLNMEQCAVPTNIIPESYIVEDDTTAISLTGNISIRQQVLGCSSGSSVVNSAEQDKHHVIKSAECGDFMIASAPTMPCRNSPCFDPVMECSDSTGMERSCNIQGRKRTAAESAHCDYGPPSKKPSADSKQLSQPEKPFDASVENPAVQVLDAVEKPAVQVLDAVDIHATAWANTWTKRRQQRRILNGLKEDSTVQLAPESYRMQSQNSASAESSSQIISCPSSAPSCSAKSDSVSLNPSATPDFLSINSSKHESGVDVYEKSTENGPIVVTDIKVAALHNNTGESRCRVIMRMKEARTLHVFHTLFAFFKKTLLASVKP